MTSPTQTTMATRHDSLTAEQVETMRRLLAEAHDLYEDMAAREADARDDEGSEFAVDRQLARRGETSLEEVRAAIQRLEAGRFGLCEGCNQPIPMERLAVLPHARRCVSCQAGTT